MVEQRTVAVVTTERDGAIWRWRIATSRERERAYGLQDIGLQDIAGEPLEAADIGEGWAFTRRGAERGVRRALRRRERRAARAREREESRDERWVEVG